MTFSKKDVIAMLKVNKKTFDLACEVLGYEKKRKFSRDEIENISNQIKIMIP